MHVKSLSALVAVLLVACGGGGNGSASGSGGAGIGGAGTGGAGTGGNSTCGNETLEPPEACDDGNTDNGDYCSADCSRITGSCGDGIIQSNEFCESGNLGCNSTCSGSEAFCGDGVVDASEECDTGFNLFSGTVGCAECRVVGFTRCEGAPSLCGPTTLDWDKPLNAYTSGDLDRYCRWLLSASYGDLPSIACGGGTTITPLEISECVVAARRTTDSCVAPLRHIVECWDGVSVCELNLSRPVLTEVASCERLACTQACDANTWECVDNKARLCNAWGNRFGDEINCGDGVCNDDGTSMEEPCDPDQCAEAIDDCDDNATCANTTPGFTCTCNVGYVGDGATCLRIPVLDTLLTNLEGLRPTFSATVLEYALDVPLLGAESVAVTASTADAVAIMLNGEPLVSGSTSDPVAFNEGTTAIEVTLQGEGYVTATYTIRVNKNVPTRIKPVSTEYDYAGASVAISRDTLIVGAPYAVSGPQIYDRIAAVTAYEWLEGAWTESARLLSASTTADRAGSSVAIDGDLVVIGEPGGVAGSVHWSERVAGTWDTRYVIRGPADADDAFGTSVAISGNTMVVGAPGEDSAATGVGGSQTNNAMLNAGAAYVFVKSGDTWALQAFLKASNTGEADAFGTSVSIDGDTIVVGAPLEDSALGGVDTDGANNDAPDSGAVYVFHRSGTTWSQEAYIQPSGIADARAGTAVDVDGDMLIVGAPSAMTTGASFVYARDTTVWRLAATLTPEPMTHATEFGTSVAMRGDHVVVGAPRGGPQVFAEIGGAYVFARGVEGWSRVGYFGGGQGRSGASVDLDTWIVVGVPGDDGSFTAVPPNPARGGDNSGALYVF